MRYICCPSLGEKSVKNFKLSMAILRKKNQHPGWSFQKDTHTSVLSLLLQSYSFPSKINSNKEKRMELCKPKLKCHLEKDHLSL